LQEVGVGGAFEFDGGCFDACTDEVNFAVE
jgi:hypothetical protein